MTSRTLYYNKFSDVAIMLKQNILDVCKNSTFDNLSMIFMFLHSQLALRRSQSIRNRSRGTTSSFAKIRHTIDRCRERFFIADSGGKSYITSWWYQAPVYLLFAVEKFVSARSSVEEGEETRCASERVSSRSRERERSVGRDI